MCCENGQVLNGKWVVLYKRKVLESWGRDIGLMFYLVFLL